MSSLKIAVRRSRPLLGTLVSIEVQSPEHANLVTPAFTEIARLQKLFDFHDPGSLLSRYNLGSTAPKAREWTELMSLVRTFENLSGGAFSPYSEGRLDLSGIAKGFIVDHVLKWFEKCKIPAVINAGGDFGFSGGSLPEIDVRMGTPQNALIRSVRLQRRALACSAIQTFATKTRTRYHLPLRTKLDAHSTVCVQAARLAVADALTKVVMFGLPVTTAKCCQAFEAIALVFNGNGELVESYGQV
jgi:thiamine biosynthesis lipoprotein ApbE